MGRVEKTVFISYRRTNMPWALAIYQNLTTHGFDVFFDYEAINAGDFEQIILGNIRARAHFLVILTPSALERCNEPNDWLRREIEAALDEKRNIVPIFLEGFDFASPSISKYLTGKLAHLKRYNGLNVPAGFFPDAMRKLRNRFLNVTLQAVLHPVSTMVQKAVQEQQVAANKAKDVKEGELTAQEWFEKGYKSNDVDSKIHCYSEAIRLKPDYSMAYYNRGNARDSKGDMEGAIKDYSEAIRLKPDYVEAFNNRGNSLATKEDYEGALNDFNEAIRLKPNYALSYNNRSDVLVRKGDFDGAIRDATQAIQLKADFAKAYNNRGAALIGKKDFEAAIQDFTRAIELKYSELHMAYWNRGIARKNNGDLDGATKDYTEAIRLSPNFANAYRNRGNVWWAKGDFYSAIVDYQRYIDLGGTDENVRVYLEKAKKKITKR